MADVKKTKAQVDTEVRSAGLALIDLSALTMTTGNVFIGKTEVDGNVRYFEIKVTAKKEDFDNDSLEAILVDRKAVEDRKSATKIAADKKKANDEKRRAEAKAKAELAKAEKGE